MVKTRGLFLFPEFSRTCLLYKSHDRRLKMFIEELEFFSLLGFLKTHLEKKYCKSKYNVGPLSPLWGREGYSSVLSLKFPKR